MIQHIVNISGGKDSTACYLLAMERGRPFRAVMADTGHENEITVDYVMRLGDRTGGPQVEMVRADFSRQMEGKRRFVLEAWPKHGVPADAVEAAAAILVPTGNVFLDLCIWKGRFPSRRAQFCTEQLKRLPMDAQVINPARLTGPVVQWIGVRRDESRNRRNAPLYQKVRTAGLHGMLFYRPLVDWTAEDCFAIAKRHGLEPNPLYRMGMRRVGCFPCINCSKPELAAIGLRFPEAFDKIAEWERLVKIAAKRGAATFFAPDVTPEGADLSKSIRREAARIVRAQGLDVTTPEGARAIKEAVAALSAAAPWPDAYAVAEWAKTARGGRQTLLDFGDDGQACSSQYGLCE